MRYSVRPGHKPYLRQRKSIIRGRFRKYVLWPGCAFYCQECGGRLTASQTVVETRPDPTLPSRVYCRTCATALSLVIGPTIPDYGTFYDYDWYQ